MLSPGQRWSYLLLSPWMGAWCKGIADRQTGRQSLGLCCCWRSWVNGSTFCKRWCLSQITIPVVPGCFSMRYSVGLPWDHNLLASIIKRNYMASHNAADQIFIIFPPRPWNKGPLLRRHKSGLDHPSVWHYLNVNSKAWKIKALHWSVQKTADSSVLRLSDKGRCCLFHPLSC